MRRTPTAFLFLATVAAVATASDKGLWFDFAPYPGARLLCTEVVAGRSGEHLTWRTLATTDEVARVVAFFEKSEKTKAERRADGSFHLGARADPARVTMSIYPARLIEMFPHCTERAKPGEQTVMLVSQML